MSGSVTLVNLAEQFQCQLTTLKHVLILRDQDGDQNCTNIMKTIRANLSQLQRILRQMRCDITKQKGCVDIIKKEFVSGTAALQDRVTHCQNNLPARLPQIQSPPATKDTSPNPTIAPPSTQPNKNSKKEPEKSSNGQAVPPPKSAKSAPALSFLTVEEFENAPKYMRGRITYEQINQTIEEFNKVLKAKHTIIHTPRSRQNDPIKQKIHAYKEQHTKDTKGIFFVVDADIKEFSSLKFDRIGTTKFTILRHCRKIREIRGGGLTRYAVC